MNNNPKIWLLTMTQNRKEDIEEMTRNIYPYFNGIIAVDHNSSDGTYEILESRKGEGRIIRRDFIMHHSHSMNELLFCRHAKNGDLMVYLDSSDIPTDLFFKEFNNIFNDLEKQNLSCVMACNRPYIWKYYDLQYFIGNPHWGIVGLMSNNIINLDEKNKELYFTNKRKEKPEVSFCLNPIKYFFCYNPSNETQIMYGKYGQNIVREREIIRLTFRMYCENELGINLNNLDGLIDYFKKIHAKEIVPSEYLINVVESEFRLSELFQLKVLNMDFMNEIVPKRYKWSFENYLKTGDGFSDENYEGTILKLNKQFNIKD